MARTVRLATVLSVVSRPLKQKSKQTRCFSAAAKRSTDGVFTELTAMRTRTPFIEAFNKQQENKLAKPVSTEDVERDLSPKSMSDSFHKVVSFTSHDAILSHIS